MAVNLEAIMQAYNNKISQASQRARTASTIDEALQIQADAYAEAIKEALETFMLTATIEGGICAQNGPITGGKIQ